MNNATNCVRELFNSKFATTPIGIPSGCRTKSLGKSNPVLFLLNHGLGMLRLLVLAMLVGVMVV
jgi:hypothetical protein